MEFIVVVIWLKHAAVRILESHFERESESFGYFLHGISQLNVILVVYCSGL